MELLLEPELQELQSSIRDFLDKEFTPQVLREAIGPESSDSVAGEVWAKAAALGWPGLVVPEEFGGSGMGWMEAGMLAQEVGRSLFFGPIHTAVVVSATITSSGNGYQKERYLPAIADGSLRVGICGWDPTRFWIDPGREPTLSGSSLVLEGPNADLLLVPCRRGGSDAIALVEVPSDQVYFADVAMVDPTRPQAKVQLQRMPVNAEQLIEGSALPALQDHMVLWLAGEQAGITQRVMELSIEHAKSRHQFGKPIGTFQAVSHKIANMYLGAEHCLSHLYHAAWSAGEPGIEASVAAWQAKVWADRAAFDATADAIQVHGGIGFTWEHDLHLHYKRARSNRVMAGEPRVLRARISQQVHG